MVSSREVKCCCILPLQPHIGEIGQGPGVGLCTCADIDTYMERGMRRDDGCTMSSVVSFILQARPYCSCVTTREYQPIHALGCNQKIHVFTTAVNTTTDLCTSPKQASPLAPKKLLDYVSWVKSRKMTDSAQY
jgi:hypothetical protein